MKEIGHPTLIQQYKVNLDTATLKNWLLKKYFHQIRNKLIVKIAKYSDQTLLLKIWNDLFVRVLNKIPEEHLQLLLKVFSILNIRV